MSLFNFLVSLHYCMYQNQASYIAIHPGLIRITKKLSYSQTGKLESPDLKVEQLIHPNSYQIFFFQVPGESLHYLMYQNQNFCIAIHPFLIRMTKKLSYSQKGKLESRDLKVGQLLHPNSYEFIQLSGESPLFYVSKSSFLHCYSSWLDQNHEEVVIFPNRKTRIT